MSLFDWVRVFSFSINVVRPECAFSWNFQTKVIVTLLTPISLSLLVLMSGFCYGCFACYRTRKKFERLRMESGKYMKISYLSMLHCWWVSLFRVWSWKLILYLQDERCFFSECEIQWRKNHVVCALPFFIFSHGAESRPQWCWELGHFETKNQEQVIVQRVQPF